MVLNLTRTWVSTILMSGAPERLTDKAGEGSTFKEIRQLATWILWSLKSAASLILKAKKKWNKWMMKEEEKKRGHINKIKQQQTQIYTKVLDMGSEQ